MSSEILVLNNSYLPIAKCSVEKSIILLLLDKAFSIKDSNKVVRSQNFQIKVPEVLVLKNVNYIKRGFTAFSKKAVMKRDNFQCQLCGDSDKSRLTLEHLIPKSRWDKVSKERGLAYGLNSFENCVILCKKDNQWKSDALPEEIGWEFTAKTPLVDFDINWDEIFGTNNQESV